MLTNSNPDNPTTSKNQLQKNVYVKKCVMIIAHIYFISSIFFGKEVRMKLNA
jgi:hypothetical protein